MHYHRGPTLLCCQIPSNYVQKSTDLQKKTPTQQNAVVAMAAFINDTLQQE